MLAGWGQMSALRTSFLNGTALALLLTLSCGAHAQEAAATAPPSAPAPVGVIGDPATFTVLGGAVEFGGQAFLNRPNQSLNNNSAKFNQYGDREEPLFLTNFNFNAAALNGTTLISGMGANVGTNNQAYELDVTQPGQNYFTYEWVSTPNLRSNNALTVFQGVGSNFLGVPNGLITELNNGGVAYPATGASAAARAAAAAHAAQVVNQLAPYEHLTTLGIQHDRQDVGYKWTPSENWTVGVDYSHDHRYGTQEQGFLFSTGTSSPLAQVPMPINDTTDNASIFAEYFGISPWGMKWNGMIKYDMSIYTDAYSQFTAENPFGGPGSFDPAGQANCPGSTTSTNCYGLGSESTYPDNGSNSITAQVGVDLPGFKSNRYMGTFQFTDMRQNATFLPMTINPALEAAYGALPRNNLDGSIDTTLVNNVITTRLNSQWQNKLTYRYYDDQNNTSFYSRNPWVINDSGIEGAPTGRRPW